MTAVLQTVYQWDIGVFHFLNGFAGNGVLDRLAGGEESINLIKGGVFLAIYWFFWFEKDMDQVDRRRTIIAVFGGALMALVVARLLANFAPFRIRPIFDPGLSYRPYSVPMSRNLESWSAFPSDTATFFAALAYGLGYLSRRLAIPIGLYTAVWICLPRMYLGIHYASDIVAGAAIGIMVAWASVRTEWLRNDLAPRLVTWAEEKPAVFYAAAFLISFEMAELFDAIRRAAHFLFRIVKFTPVIEPLPIAALLLFVALSAVAGLAQLVYRNRQSQVAPVRRWRLRLTTRW